MGVEFEIEFLVLGSDQLRLRRVLDAQHLCTNSLYIVAQFTRSETIGRERINNSEHIAKLIVESRSQDTLRQRPIYVGNLLAHLIPNIGDRILRRVIKNVDVDCGDARLGFALEVVK